MKLSGSKKYRDFHLPSNKTKKKEIVQNLEHGLFQASLVGYKQNKKCVFQALSSTQKKKYLG